MKKVVFANASYNKVKEKYNYANTHLYPEINTPITERRKGIENLVKSKEKFIVVTEDILTLASIIFYSKKYSTEKKLEFFFFDGEKEDKVDNPDNLFIFYNNELNKVII